MKVDGRKIDHGKPEEIRFAAFEAVQEGKTLTTTKSSRRVGLDRPQTTMAHPTAGCFKGAYLIVMTYQAVEATNSDASDPASGIFSAVHDQLGLRLYAQRGMVEVLKVSSVNKVPTEN